ncbi:MAG: glutamate racemase [Planctomycetota bacterium]
MDERERPIGVFDSGVGGLSVLRAMRERLPDERFVYLGDTARVPYGTKSAETVRRYAINAAGFFEDRGVKTLVVACNSASSVALDALRERWGDRPVIGVIEPGARASAAAGSDVLVLATEATVASGAYERAIRGTRPDARVRTIAATLLVALAEEGWTAGPTVEAVVRDVLSGVVEEAVPACVLLGCTHFPLLADAIGRVLGRGVRIVDSARTTADEVARVLDERGLACPNDDRAGDESLCVTDGAERFARIASRFLGRPVDAGGVMLVDLV